MRFRILDILLHCVVSWASILASFLVHFQFGPALPEWAFFYVLASIAWFAIIAHMVLTSIIYRAFKLKAHWLPKCPTCGNKHRHYFWFVEESVWPSEVVYCGNCNQKVVLFYEETSTHGDDSTVPRFLLLWPQSWGRWKRMGEEK